MGKLFITEMATCICKFGTSPGKLKIESNKKVFINGSKKIATSGDLKNTFLPPGFGTCNFNSPYTKPCAPSVTKWSGLYQSLRLPGKFYPLLPESKAICAVAGSPCIEIIDHGQIEIPGVAHIKNSTGEHSNDLDPMCDSQTLYDISDDFVVLR